MSALQLASEARERKKKFSGSVEVLRFERTLDLTRRQLRRTDNIARNDARLQASLTRMYRDQAESCSVKSDSTENAASSSAAGLAVPSDRSRQKNQSTQNDSLLSVAMTTTATSVGTTSVVMTSVAKVTTAASLTTTASVVTTAGAGKTTIASFTVMSTMASTSLAVSEAANTTSCVTLPANSTNSAAASVAEEDKTKFNSSSIKATQSSSFTPAVAVASLTTSAVGKSSDQITLTSDKSTDSVARSAGDVAVKSVDSVTQRSADSSDAAAVATCESVDSSAVLPDAGAVKSSESTTVAAGKSADAVVGPVDDKVRAIAPAPASVKALPISAPNVRNLATASTATPQSPSPSPKGHVTFSDHVTEIQPSAGGGNGAANGGGKPRGRVPPAPPPRRAIKNFPPSSASREPHQRPSSAVEPLATVDVHTAVNGVSRARPLSMAPLATVDSDSDSSVGVDTGTVRRNTAASEPAERRRDTSVEQRNGGRGRTPPPVPTRKTSALSSGKNNAELLTSQDSQYSNLDDVRQECARLELASSLQRDATRANGKNGGVTAAKCEETEIY